MLKKISLLALAFTTSHAVELTKYTSQEAAELWLQYDTNDDGVIDDTEVFDVYYKLKEQHEVDFMNILIAVDQLRQKRLFLDKNEFMRQFSATN